MLFYAKIMIEIILQIKLFYYHYYRSIFITGFGGNVIRENVRLRAQWFVTNFDDLIKSL